MVYYFVNIGLLLAQIFCFVVNCLTGLWMIVFLCVSGLIDLGVDYFSRFYVNNLSDSELSSIFTLVELISLREGYFSFDNSNFSFSRTDVKLYIDYFSTL